MRRGSFAAPLFLIALGAIFLINNIVPEMSVWRILADWWPVLLIAFGLIRLVEVLAAYQRGNLMAPVARPMGFGWILTIVFVGVALSIPHHLNTNWHWGPIRSRGVDLFGERFDFPVTASTAAPAARRLILDNIRGNVSVSGVDGTEVKVDGHKVIRAYDRGAAEKVNDQTNVTFSVEGDVLFLRATEASTPDQSRLSMDLDISVPKGMNIEARGRSGDLSVSSVDGSVDVSSQKGEIRLRDLGGNAKLDVEHCELMRATNVKGTIELQGNGRDIQLETIGGQVTIGGRFSGTLDFRELAKPLHFESEQTDLRVEKLPGTISMDLGDLRATNIGGPVRLVTHSRDVHLEDFSGPVEIEVGRGDVDLKPTKGQLARMDIRSRHGNIELELPVAAAFDLKATAQQGDVTNDYGDGVIAESQGRTNIMRSSNGSGPQIVLNTERGEVSVRKSE